MNERLRRWNDALSGPSAKEGLNGLPDEIERHRGARTCDCQTLTTSEDDGSRESGQRPGHDRVKTIPTCARAPAKSTPRGLVNNGESREEGARRRVSAREKVLPVEEALSKEVSPEGENLGRNAECQLGPVAEKKGS